MSSKIFITGFGPFEQVPENPSEFLAKQCGLPYGISEVSYDATRRFLSELDQCDFDVLLMMGAHAQADRFHLEFQAHNRIGAKADVRGYVPPESPIRDGEPLVMLGTLWSSVELQDIVTEGHAVLSYDPGSYLCNFIYYEALHRFQDKRVGFLHVPLPTLLPLDDQQKTLGKLIERITAC
jgi:pyrrolidone-carboxylate peptidase